MGSSNSGSKRLSLRFNAGGHTLRYKTEFEDGTGVIENISAGGCALKTVDIALVLHEKILLLLSVDPQEEVVEIGAQVVRVEDDSIAVQFTDISEEKKQQIVKYFAGLQRQQKK